LGLAILWTRLKALGRKVSRVPAVYLRRAGRTVPNFVPTTKPYWVLPRIAQPKLTPLGVVTCGRVCPSVATPRKLFILSAPHVRDQEAGGSNPLAPTIPLAKTQTAPARPGPAGKAGGSNPLAPTIFLHSRSHNLDRLMYTVGSADNPDHRPFQKRSCEKTCLPRSPMILGWSEMYTRVSKIGNCPAFS
jgi:hypothetical protein